MAGKRYRAAAESIDADATYSVADAVKLVKSNAKAKFDETVEIAALRNIARNPYYFSFDFLIFLSADFCSNFYN